MLASPLALFVLGLVAELGSARVAPRSSYHEVAARADTTQYTLLGCFKEFGSTRILPGAELVDAKTMTPAVCQAFCQSKGFSYAGLECTLS
jgi:hypothetical protein